MTGTIVKNVYITSLLNNGVFQYLLLNKDLNSLYIGGYLTYTSLHLPYALIHLDSSLNIL
jgi:hypothetical protein